jgi:Protein of unknown function (DUF2877)
MIEVVRTRQVEAGVVAAALMSGAPTECAVFAVFDRACYLRDPLDRVLVLTDGSAPRGPLHLVLDRLPSLRPGDQVRVGEGRAVLPRGEVVLGSTWRGATPRLAQSYPLATRLFRESVAPEPFGAQSRELADLLGTRDLDALAALVGGRGPGLTPTGDDVLAGAMIVARLQGHPARALKGVVLQARSNTIATAFLRAAADGHCIEPAHALVHAVHGDAELRKYCASSGAALTYGILGSLTLAS